MERKGKWTMGPVTTTFSDGGGGNGYIIGPGDDVIVWGGEDDWGCQRGWKRPEDAHLIASAFNSATSCEDMGYDGEACVKALPELVVALEWICGQYDYHGTTSAVADAAYRMFSEARAKLEACRG